MFKEPLEKMSRSRFCKHPKFQREATFALVIIKKIIMWVRVCMVNRFQAIKETWAKDFICS